MDFGDGVGEEERDAEILEALLDVPGEAAGIGHQLGHHLHLRPLEGHPAGHNQADVAAAEDDDLLARHIALDVDELLGGAGGVDAGRAGAGDVQCPAVPLPAAHREDHRPGGALGEAVLLADGGQVLHPLPVRLKGEDHRRGEGGDLQFRGLFREPGGVFGAGELLAEPVDAEAVVDALEEDAPQFRLPLKDQDIAGGDAVFRRGHCRRQPRRAAADDDQLPGNFFVHMETSFVKRYVF